MWGMEKAKELMMNFFGRETENPAEVALLDETVKQAVIDQFEQEVIADIKAKYEERRTQRNPIELQMRLNINFFNGDQFTRIDAYKNDIEEVLPLFTWEERNAFNEIAPSIETRFAILSKRKNNLKNRPASASSEDRTSAKIGNKVLASTRNRLGMSELQQEATHMAGILGTAVWKTIWDASAGKVVGLEMREIDQEEAENSPLKEYEKTLFGGEERTITHKIHEGDVVTTVHSPFEIFPENVSIPCRLQKRIMHVVLMSPEEVFEKWGKVVKGKDNETYKIMASDNKAYGSAFEGLSSGFLFSSTTVHNSVKVYEEWEMPTAQYPEGRLIICSDEKLFYYGPLPDAYGDNGEYILPFDVQQALKTDGFFGISVVERMIPLQIRYNSVKNRIQDYINRVSIGVLTAEEGSLVDEDYLLDEGIAPGSLIVHRRGTNPPRYMNTDSLPDDLYREEQNLLNAFDRYSGVSQLAKQSTVPSQVTSGVAIAGLAEQDDTRIGLEAENIKQCLIRVGKKWLNLYHNNVAYPRMVKELGKNNEFEIEQFVGSDLTSFDIFVESEPESSDTLAQRRQKVVELLNGGLFNDPQTGNITAEGRAKVFEMLELGDWESFVEADDDQKRKAQRENNAMITGEPATVAEFDDDIIHISVHNNFRLKAEYEDYVRKSPELDALFEQHVNEHLTALQRKSETEQMMNQPGPYIQRSALTPATFGGTV